MTMDDMDGFRNKKAFVLDMDGVVYHGNRLLPGAKEFVEWMKSNGRPFLFLTNSSERTPRELREKMSRLGIDLDESNFHTSAIATANFIARQKPGCSAFVIGEAGLINALYERGISMNDTNPDFVVVGETRSYGYERLEKACFLVQRGAKLIGCNPDLTGPIEGGIVPATGSLISPIEMTTGVKAYFLGKPNPIMMRHAVKRLNSSAEETMIIGDRMDTDILAGVEAEIDTALMLSGVTSRADLGKFAYAPDYVFEGLFDIVSKL